MRTYLDTSALAKLVARERESDALRDYLEQIRSDTFFTAAITRTELVRAARRVDAALLTTVRHVLDALAIIDITTGVLDAAALLDPPALRSLDAIHLVAARRAGAELRGVITYDSRMTDAARSLVIPVVAPGLN